MGNNKSFEELLAEQLGCDTNELGQDPVFERTDKISRKSSEPRKFLKKGAGLVRYGGVGGAPVKGLSRSKSQGNVGQDKDGKRVKNSVSCSKLDIADRETIAFASKKTPPKRTLSIKSVSSVGSVTPSSSVKPSPKQTSAAKKATSPATTLRKTAAKNSKTSAVSNSVQKASKVKEVLTTEAQLPVYDSVELSFREKLKKAGQKQEVIQPIMKLFTKAIFCCFKIRKSCRP